MVSATTLVEFLRARYDEIERLARAADDEVEVMGGSWEGVARIMLARASYDDTADHFEQHSPAAVLADVEAKRRIVEMMASISPGDEVNPIKSEDAVALADWTLQILALPFAHHPDYDPSWRPAEVTA